MHLPPLDVAVYPVVTMNHGRHTSRSARASSTVSSISSSSSASSPICAPSADFSGIQRAIQSVFRSSRITVQKADRLPGRLHQVYRAQLADGSIFVLKCPPHVSSRALRHEKHGLETELKTLRYLREYRQGQLPVPEVYQYQEHGGVLGSSFLLMSYVPGRRLSEVLPYLSAYERNAIDRALGSYMRTITMLNAQQFGMTHNVFANKGSRSWREAFRALLESALRDCEDMLVTLPYDSIRYYVEQHLYTLDEIQTPCMVAMDMCDPQSVLVDEQTKQITGLVGFSNVIWGDPLMNEAVANGSDAFFEGYGERPPRLAAPHARQLM
jgi:aminoglycoside phosphotransferase (APT) family kinase protein